MGNIEEKEKDLFKIFYMRRKVKNALAIQSVTKDSSRSFFVDCFLRAFENADFANMDNPFVEETESSIQQAETRNQWHLKINTFQFDKISKDIFSRLKKIG